VLPTPDKEFWNEREVVTIDEPAAVCILVCGNCGVGKSSLVNTVFGVEVVSD
jgi:predicted GTPase